VHVAHRATDRRLVHGLLLLAGRFPLEAGDADRLPADLPARASAIEDAEARKAKYARLAGWLLKQNNGLAPDVIVGNEIESRRAAELLDWHPRVGVREGIRRAQQGEG